MKVIRNALSVEFRHLQVALFSLNVVHVPLELTQSARSAKSAHYQVHAYRSLKEKEVIIKCPSFILT